MQKVSQKPVHFLEIKIGVVECHSALLGRGARCRPQAVQISAFPVVVMLEVEAVSDKGLKSCAIPHHPASICAEFIDYN